MPRHRRRSPLDWSDGIRRRKRDFPEVWPFAPHCMPLLENQVLVATDDQEMRDLIRILADLFKSRGEASPIVMAADFRPDDEPGGIAARIDSVANQHHAAPREKAQRNLTAVLGTNAVVASPVCGLYATACTAI